MPIKVGCGGYSPVNNLYRNDVERPPEVGHIVLYEGEEYKIISLSKRFGDITIKIKNAINEHVLCPRMTHFLMTEEEYAVKEKISKF